MSQILNDNEIKEFNKNGAIHLKGKFDIKWIEKLKAGINKAKINPCLLYTSPSPRDATLSRMPSSA